MNAKLLQKNEIIVVYSYRGNGQSDEQKLLMQHNLHRVA